MSTNFPMIKRGKEGTNKKNFGLHLSYRYLCMFSLLSETQVLAGSVESIAICLSIVVVLKLGLRVNLFLYMVVAGLSCILMNFIPDGNLWVIISLAMIGELDFSSALLFCRSFEDKFAIGYDR